MTIKILLVLVGFALIIFGADVLVDGTSNIAKKYRIPDVVIGLTIVSLGTSFPEMMITITSAKNEYHDLIFGNALGSNIVNLSLILGIIALIKLETISRALWGKNYQPKPDASGNSRFYFPWFALWTEREIKETEGLVYIPIIDALNNRAGFGCASTPNAPSDTHATVGSRLWQESREKAKYFGQQFIELWFDYLMFNVKKVQE